MIEFLTQNALYVVLVTALIIWAGIAFYLQRLDSRLRELERRNLR
ncbi:MAG: CcmD family protein [Candidatus Kapabacteria bacterium]|nr:CcmD family protein [Candidatus Kapabacteria bacterium]